MKKKIALIFTTQLLIYSLASGQEQFRQTIEWDPQLTETWEPVPNVVFPKLNNQPPSDAIILFDGQDLDKWENGNKWSLENGELTIEPGTGGINTKERFGDIQLHIEWRIPEDVDGDGQRRGNSGIFLQGRRGALQTGVHHCGSQWRFNSKSC